MVEIILASTDRDIQDALAIRKTVFVEEQGVDLSLERDEYDEQGIHFLARWQDIPVGTGRLVVVGQCGKIGRLCVLREFRRRGIGQALMSEIEEEAKKRGLTRLYLHAQSHATVFYARLGYRAVGDEFWEAGIKHIQMEKGLQG